MKMTCVSATGGVAGACRSGVTRPRCTPKRPSLENTFLPAVGSAVLELIGSAETSVADAASPIRAATVVRSIDNSCIDQRRSSHLYVAIFNFLVRYRGVAPFTDATRQNTSQ